ncbi:MAG: UDP-N-acetylmuramate--L-alanine ligase [Chlamydiae bacterium]|nr:UDP-N-acetylmuramate--L-alanine ligase [Chlamydiota bacterium]MBI3267008.1 UDP-N-acetylmuramate--L-alanine ligase [Chlamydiota bacterium]
MKIHLIGIGGSGMSALACILSSQGHEVSGSDRRKVSLGEKIRVYQGHHPSYVEGRDCVVFSSAINGSHVERAEAKRSGVSLLHRSQMLWNLMKEKKSIAVSGMHGKTSTTGMIAKILLEGRLDPTVAVGGDFPFLSGNARNGQGDWALFEADESDGSLLEYHPQVAVITNLEPEHLDFFKDFNEIVSHFKTFVGQVSGPVLVCSDDLGCRRLIEQYPGVSFITYGFSESTQLQASQVKTLPWRSKFHLSFKGNDLGEISLNISGRHQILNALAAVGVGLQAGVEFSAIQKALENFEGAARRFQVKGQFENTMFVDDYAHHPTEIQATIQNARLCFSGKLLGVFQPHRYSRTYHLKEQFGRAFEGLDHVVITDVYASHENPIAGVTGRSIYEEIVKWGKPSVEYISDREGLRNYTLENYFAYQAVLTLGAGDITNLGQEVLDDLQMKKNVLDSLKGRILKGESMAKHTTFHLGGPADFWIEPCHLEELLQVQQWARKKGLPLFVIGNGSNVIVKDGGIRGVVVRLSSPSFRQWNVEGENLTVGSGLSLAEVIQIAMEASLSGLENLKGIPGTIGGALHFNAGAYGSEIGDALDFVTALTPEGALETLSRQKLQLKYRTCLGLRGKIALQARFRLVPSDPRKICEKMIVRKNKRVLTYPRLPNAGCIFKNPSGFHAGELIDQSGLKDLSYGEAQVSSQHANFIVNKGKAKASDVISLIEQVRNRVYQEKKVLLENEVEVVGED